MPIKLGTVETVDLETGQVVNRQTNAFTLLPPDPELCQECGVDHPWDAPHNRDSLYYGMAFNAKHGRYPTWTDAMAHCPPATRVIWRRLLCELLVETRQAIPADLQGEP